MTRFFVAAACAMCVFAGSSYASVPSSITVQGRLTDASNVPITTAVTFHFRIFDAPSGGTLIWPPAAFETQILTPNAEGLWSAEVGHFANLTEIVFADSVRWLEIEANGTVLPRVRLVTGPYAFRVTTVDGATGGNITSKLSIGSGHTNSGTHAFTAGTSNVASGHGASVTGGSSNIASGMWSHIGGGEENVADTTGACVGGGDNNVASQSNAVVAGGSGNHSSGDRGAIIGGVGNLAEGPFSVVGGGYINKAIGNQAAVVGGGYNNASGDLAFIGGGGGSAGNPIDSNAARGIHSVIGGGVRNTSIGANSAILGGSRNVANGQGSTVGGGSSDTAVGDNATVGGGDRNVAGFDYATIAGGLRNRAIGTAGAIGGGSDNRADFYCAVGGGVENSALGDYSTVGGGYRNRAYGIGSVISGGGGGQPADTNHASGTCSTIPGGARNRTTGNFAFAAGRGSHALHRSAFVWADSAATAFASTGVDQFLIRAAGGVGIGTNDPEGPLHVFETSAGTVTANANSIAVFERSNGGWISMLSSDASQRGILFSEPNMATAGGIVFDDGQGSGTNGLGFRTGGNTTRMFLDSAGNLNVTGNITASGTCCASDERFKCNIQTLPNALEAVKKLRGVSYEWKTGDFPDRNFGEGEQVGLIAQEVRDVVPQAVIEQPDGYLAVDYTRLVPLLIQGIKEQQQTITQLSNRVADLEKKLEQ